MDIEPQVEPAQTFRIKPFWITYGFLAVAAMFAIVVGGFLVLASNNVSKELSVIQPVVSQNNPYAGWKTYQDNKSGFEFRYPSEFGDPVISTYKESTDCGSGVHAETQLVSFKNLNIGFACDYSATDSVSGGTPKKVQVAGRESYVYSYTSAVGYNNTEVYISMSDGTYLSIFYTFKLTASGEYVELKSGALDKILSTFKFIEPQTKQSGLDETTIALRRVPTAILYSTSDDRDYEDYQGYFNVYYQKETEADGICRVYAGSAMLDLADCQSFAVLSKENSTKNSIWPIAKDSTNVYFGPNILDADAVTFEVVEDELIFKDRNSIYILDNNYGRYGKVLAVTGVDPATFQKITLEGKYTHFFKDKNHVYYLVRDFFGNLSFLSLELDPKTFEIVSENLSKDADGVYITDLVAPQLLLGISPQNFRYLGNLYYTDDKAVYYKEWHSSPKDAASYYELVTVPQADVSSFVITNKDGIDAHDQNKTYFQGKPL